MIPTLTGDLPAWECSQSSKKAFFVFIFFSSFAIIAAMVVMSLFIGVIAMGMVGEHHFDLNELNLTI